MLIFFAGLLLWLVTFGSSYCLGRALERDRCRKIVNRAHAKVTNLSTWSDGWQHACRYALRLINGEPGY